MRELLMLFFVHFLAKVVFLSSSTDKTAASLSKEALFLTLLIDVLNFLFDFRYFFYRLS